MGRQKLLLPWAGKLLVRHLVDELLASLLDEVVVVTGPDHEGVSSALSGAKVSLVQNPRTEDGMLSSVRIGLLSVAPDVAGFMVVLGDQPSLNASLIDRLIREWREDTSRIVRPRFGDRNGHPVLIPAEYRQRVLSEFDDVGLKGLLRAVPERIRAVSVADPGAVTDVDTPDQLAEERARLGIFDGD